MTAQTVEGYETAIAIIGMTGRFPGARTVAEYWNNLLAGVCSVSTFTDEQLLEAGVEPELLRRSSYVRAGGIVEGADLFDAGFFGYNPREAEITDPQHRLFLESACEVLEQAGYGAGFPGGRTGLFAGAGMSGYLLNLLANSAILEEVGPYLLAIGNDKDHLATRVAYNLNLKGPCVTVQTACSTSLVAVHLACQSLLNHECDMALAGGVSVRWPQERGYLHQEGGVLSPDGYCRAFDSQAEGTVSGNGVGVVVLKRYADALRDGDTIHTLILGSAINNDGSEKVGYTAPSVAGQAAVIVEALAAAGISPATIGYVEAHGTGTALGDPIELAALTQAFRESTAATRFCAIGSVKTNIGHLDAAAGIAGLIKAVLAVKHGQIPPSLHFRAPNPQIDFETSPFFVADRLLNWSTEASPRRASVSSFGLGGTNAHVILEQPPAAKQSGAARPWQLLTLSAKNQQAIRKSLERMQAHLQDGSTSLADVAYTLQVGRRAFTHRAAFVCRDTVGALEALSADGPRGVITSVHEGGNRPVYFMFPGQGAQHPNMAREIYDSEPAFRDQVDLLAERLIPHLDLDIRSVLFPRPEQAEAAASQLSTTAITQPALFVISYSLARLWMSLGVRPQAMIGHSVGEYVAACLAGVMSLEDALALIAARGRLVQQMPAGAMLSVNLPEDEILPLLDHQLSLAAVNGKSLVVVAGPVSAIDRLQCWLDERGVGCRRLQTSHAFHSWMMEPAGPALEGLLGKLTLHPPQVPYISNLTGTWIRPDQATDPAYWRAHLLRPVRMAEGLREMLTDPDAILLEVGPGQVMCALARGESHPLHRPVLASLPQAHHAEPQMAHLLEALGRLWLAGAAVDWAAFYAGQSRHRVPVPSYPFEREAYRITPNIRSSAPSLLRIPENQPHEPASWFSLPSWKRTIPRRGTVPSDGEPWLVFSAGTAVEASLMERLRSNGIRVTVVEAGEDFASTGPLTFTLPPVGDEGYRHLLETLRDRGELPARIIHGWGMASVDRETDVWERFAQAQRLGFYSLLALARALASVGTARIRITALTANAQSVALEDRFFPEKGTALGACLVIPQEFPHLSCTTVDVTCPPVSSRQEEYLTDLLLGELTSEPTDLVVAYRGADRWVRTYEPVSLEPTGATRLRHGGVYLITGGLGRIGLLLAEHLARSVQAKLILVGRSPIPERTHWEEWLATRGEADRTSRIIQCLRRVEALGSQVLVLHADVANEGQMEAALAKTVSRFGGLHGVIHAAFAESFSPIQNAYIELCEAQFHPKAYGVLVLERLLRSKRLDFVLLMSSLSTVLGGTGLAPYVAANLFLDGFAELQNRVSLSPWLSVNWDAWHLADHVDARAAGLDQAISPTQGLVVFDRLLEGIMPGRMVVSTGNLSARLARWPRTGPGATTANRDDTRGRPNLPTPYAAPRNQMEQTIAEIASQLLGLSTVGVHDNFFELGGHSLLGTQFVSRLREMFQVELSIRRLFEGPTVAAIAEEVLKLQSARDVAPTLAITVDRPNDSAQLLERLNELTDEEVEALLRLEMEKDGVD